MENNADHAEALQPDGDVSASADTWELKHLACHSRQLPCSVNGRSPATRPLSSATRTWRGRGQPDGAWPQWPRSRDIDTPGRGQYVARGLILGTSPASTVIGIGVQIRAKLRMPRYRPWQIDALGRIESTEPH
ncbi:hypothetical protein GY45DRAFT_1319530 [Cubamyces sp. BRFM 1775]|nr:hypothetical protein GY45DRAFT_1319530 [Cubamyces sp. BRFM 1775]